MWRLEGSRGSMLHLSVLCGYQGVDTDPYVLQLTHALMQAALQEARVCSTGQPFVLVGDFDVDHPQNSMRC